MLDLLSTRSLGRNCDGVTRRDFLKIGTLGLAGGLTLPQLLRAQSESTGAGKPKRNTSVVLLFLFGGASQKETFDPKPEAVQEHRCLFGPTATTLPGIQFCSLLPRMAKMTDKLAVIRSLVHEDSGHEGGTHWVKTGYGYPPRFQNKGDGIPQTHPSIGSIVARCRGAVDPVTGVPTYAKLQQKDLQTLSDDAAWLGQAYAPFQCAGARASGIMSDLTLKVAPERLEDRRALLREFDRIDRAMERNGVMQGMDSFAQQAVTMLNGGKLRLALDVTREPDSVRAKYGSGLLGQQMLMARRLCEAGAGFVTVTSMGWDHHEDIVPGCKNLCPQLDHAAATFLEDMQQRGMTDDILLVIMGEFGRTPYMKGNGRDHWPGINNVVLAGGGLRMGQVIGESDGRGGAPRSRAIWPQDLMATIFHVLGIDPKVQFVHPSGRPTSMIEEGAVVPELV